MKNKKGYLLNQQTAIIIIVVLLAFFYLGGSSSLSTASFFSTSTTEKTTETITNTETIEEQTDLCALFQPYVVAGDTISACNSLMGSWECREDFVGCYDTTIAGIDCSGAVIRTAMYQCQSVGGEYYCDVNNAYCVR